MYAYAYMYIYIPIALHPCIQRYVYFHMFMFIGINFYNDKFKPIKSEGD